MTTTPISDRIVVEVPDRMTLVAYFLRSLLTNRLALPGKDTALERLNGTVALYLGTMTLGLRFEGGKVYILPEPPPHPTAWIKGSMAALVGAITRRKIITPVIKGELFAWGNPAFLLRLAPIFF